MNTAETAIDLNCEVICHDHCSLINASIREVNESGCELLSKVRSDGPLFARQSQVILNLLDPASGRAMNVLGRLVGVRREDGAWAYKIRWNGLPTLVAELLAAA